MSKKYQITQLQLDDSLLVLHPETDADIVVVDNTSGHYAGTSTDVQSALEEVYSMAATGGVQSVNGRTGAVTLTKSDVGLDNVTNDAQIKGLASGTTNGDLVKFGADGYTVADAGVAVSTAVPSASSTDTELPTAKAVWTAIDNMPEPMLFKGSLGTGGTITALPAASAANEGYVYKVITAGTYQSLVCKVGDTVISTGSEWVLIPSGDEPGGTVTSVGAGGASGSHITTSGSPITSSGTITIGVESGYSIPSDSAQSGWSAKYDLPSGGIPKEDLASAVQTSLGNADTALQENQTITLTGDANGSGKTSIAVTLANSGVTAGSGYSAFSVNAKGLVTAAGTILEVGDKSVQNGNTPSNLLAVGGIFFKEV